MEKAKRGDAEAGERAAEVRELFVFASAIRMAPVMRGINAVVKHAWRGGELGGSLDRR